MIIVSDTSPLRGLIALNKTELLFQLFHKVIIPKAVEIELLRITPLQSSVQNFLHQSWVEVRQTESSPDYHIIRKYLDEGESEAIILARQLRADLLLIDESKGREFARGLHLKVLGLIGVLIKAKRASLISALKPLLDELINEHGFWIKKDFYETILNSVDE